MSAAMFYVCDHCGLLEAREPVAEGAVWRCESCGSPAAWEFPPGRRSDAEFQSTRIERLHRSGLFRRS